MKPLQAKTIANPNILYILINIFVSAVGFVRSFLFMKWLGMEELGLISLVQTVMMFLGLFQLGLLNGGYRIFALDRANEQKSINNLLFSYFTILAGVGLVVWGVLAATGTKLIMSNDLLLVAFVCGMFMLVNNWLTNTLIGKRLIKNINRINLISSICSMALLPLVVIWQIGGAVAVLISQPLIFVAVALFGNKELRPTGWNFNFKQIRYILSFGFIPFLTGISVMINMQVERWSIAELLGTAALGEYYMVFLFTTLFVLIPASLSSLFFPRTIKAYEDGQMALFRHNIKNYTVILLGYLGVVVVLTLVLLQPVVDWIFPIHSGGTVYVYWFLLGMVFYTLCDPIGLIMNSMVKLRPMLWAGLLGIVLNFSLILISDHFYVFSLMTMTWIKITVNFAIFACYLTFFFSNYNVIFNKTR